MGRVWYFVNVTFTNRYIGTLTYVSICESLYLALRVVFMNETNKQEISSDLLSRLEDSVLSKFSYIDSKW